MASFKRYFIVGGAGFIGSHCTDRLLLDSSVSGVTLFDNFSTGRHWHYEMHARDPRFRVVCGDAKDIDSLTSAMAGHNVVIHLASNPDITRAVMEPDVDFREGTLLTNNVVEAMRRAGLATILYASGSGVYGDVGGLEVNEEAPLNPVSTYGASKLAGEALIRSYCHMFEFTGRAFRFGNVVGPRQTHGVGFDFLHQLLENPRRLRILGDGNQSKSYIHVQDIVDAILLAEARSPTSYAVYNVATDYITVTEIAVLAAECAGLNSREVEFEYTGGNRGWKGDVPVVRMNSERIRRLGWECRRGSREALRESMLAMLPEMKAGRL
jgi:UDP-glucose 4-epimerase